MFENDIILLKQDNEKLVADNGDMKGKIVSLSSQLKEASDAELALRSELESEYQSKLDVEITKLEFINGKLTSENLVLKEAQDGLLQKLDEANDTQKSLKSDVQVLSSEQNDFLDEKRKSQEEIRLLKTSFETLELVMGEKISNLSKKVEEAQGSEAKLKRELKRVCSALEENEAKGLADMDQLKMEHSRELRNLISQVQSLQQELEEQKMEMESNIITMKDLHVERSDALDKVSNLEAKLEEAGQSYKTDTEQLKRAAERGEILLCEYKDNLEKLYAKVQEVETSSATEKRAHSVAQDLIGNIEGQVSELTSRLFATEKTCQTVIQEHEIAQTLICNMESQITVIIEERDVAQKLIQNIELQLQEIEHENNQNQIKLQEYEKLQQQYTCLLEDNKHLESKVGAMQASSKESVQANKVLQVQCEALSKELEIVNSKLASFETEYKRVGDEKMAILTQVESAKTERDSWKLKFETINAKLSKYIKSLVTTMTDGKVSTKDLNFAEAFKKCVDAHNELKVQVETLKENAAGLCKVKEGLTSSLKDATDKNQIILEEKKMLKKRIDDLNALKDKSMSESRTRMDEILKEFCNTKQDLEKAYKEKESSVIEVESMSNELEILKEKVQSLEAQVTASHDTSSQYAKEVPELKKHIIDKDSELEEARRTIEKAALVTRELDQRLSESDADNERLRESLTLSSLACEDFQAKIERITQDFNEHRDMEKKMAIELVKFETEIKELQKKLAESDNKAQIASQECQIEATKVEEKIQELEAMAKVLEGRDLSLSKAEADLRTMSLKVTDFEKDAVSSKEKIALLYKKLSEHEITIENAKEELVLVQKASETEVKALEHLIAELEDKLEVLNSSLEAAEAIAEVFKSENFKQTAEIKGMLNSALIQVKELAKENNELISEVNAAQSRLEEMQQIQDSEKRVRQRLESGYIAQKTEKCDMAQTLEETRRQLEESRMVNYRISQSLKETSKNITDLTVELDRLKSDHETDARVKGELTAINASLSTKLQDTTRQSQNLLEELKIVRDSAHYLYSMITKKSTEMEESATCSVVDSILKSFVDIEGFVSLERIYGNAINATTSSPSSLSSPLTMTMLPTDEEGMKEEQDFPAPSNKDSILEEAAIKPRRKAPPPPPPLHTSSSFSSTLLSKKNADEGSQIKALINVYEQRSTKTSPSFSLKGKEPLASAAGLNLMPDSAVELIDDFAQPTRLDHQQKNLVSMLKNDFTQILDRAGVSEDARDRLLDVLKEYIEARIAVERLLYESSLAIKNASSEAPNTTTEMNSHLQDLKSMLSKVSNDMAGLRKGNLGKEMPERGQESAVNNDTKANLEEIIKEKDEQIRELTRGLEERDQFVRGMFSQATEIKKSLKTNMSTVNNELSRKDSVITGLISMQLPNVPASDPCVGLLYKVGGGEMKDQESIIPTTTKKKMSLRRMLLG